MEFELDQEDQVGLDSSASSYAMHSNVEACFSEPTRNLRPRRPKMLSNLESKVVIPSILSIGISEKRCCICTGSHPNVRRNRIPHSATSDIWKTEKIWIPRKNRCCPSHILNGKFSPASKVVLQQKAKPGARLSTQEIDSIISNLQNSKSGQQLQLDKDDLEEHDYDLLFGVSKQEFDELLQVIVPHMRSTNIRSKANALGILLMKIRLGVSQKLIGYHFNVSQRKVSKILWRVANILGEHFVPRHLGFQHMTRDEFRRLHSSEFVRKLYNIPVGKIVLFFDGKYYFSKHK